MIWTVLHFMHWISSMKLFLRPKTLWSKKWFMEMKRICFIALVVVCGGKYSLSQIDFYQYSIQQKLSIFTNREIMQQSCKKNKRFKNNFIWIPSQPSNRIVLVQVKWDVAVRVILNHVIQARANLQQDPASDTLYNNIEKNLPPWVHGLKHGLDCLLLALSWTTFTWETEPGKVRSDARCVRRPNHVT